MENEAVNYWCHDVLMPDGQVKRLEIRCGDLCETTEPYDVLVCSAFRGDYAPVYGTLIGALYRRLNIEVDVLARNPQMDLRAMGCWLSHEIPGVFRRVACVELLDLYDPAQAYQDSVMLKSTFSTLRFVLEQADLRGIPVGRVALPILGTGDQGIDLCYIAGPLVNQCVQALRDIPGLNRLTFYERNPAKVAQIAEILERLVAEETSSLPQVFLSYSSRQSELAFQIRDALTRQHIACWMAPDSIPAGSCYQFEIPTALSQVQLVVLLLTPEAEKSKWVQKEIGAAIGNGRDIVPYQPYAYVIGKQFMFLLDGEQIFPAWKYTDQDSISVLAQQVREKLTVIV